MAYTPTCWPIIDIWADKCRDPVVNSEAILCTKEHQGKGWVLRIPGMGKLVWAERDSATPFQQTRKMISKLAQNHGAVKLFGTSRSSGLLAGAFEHDIG